MPHCCTAATLLKPAACAWSLRGFCDARRGEVTDYVLMEGRGFGFVTFRDASHAQQFLEVRGLSRLRSMPDALLMTD